MTRSVVRPRRPPAGEPLPRDAGFRGAPSAGALTTLSLLSLGLSLRGGDQSWRSFREDVFRVLVYFSSRRLERLWGTRTYALYCVVVVVLSGLLRKLIGVARPLTLLSWALLLRIITDIPEVSPDPLLPNLLPSNTVVPHSAAFLGLTVTPGIRSAVVSLLCSACISSNRRLLVLVSCLEKFLSKTPLSRDAVVVHHPLKLESQLSRRVHFEDRLIGSRTRSSPF